MTATRTVPWYDLYKPVTGFATGTSGEVLVQREAIPIIFVPGIMGSRLRRTAPTPNEAKLPSVRWDPSSALFMLKHYSGEGPVKRKQLLIGSKFDPDYLEVDNSDPVGNGFNGIMSAYHRPLQNLQNNDWGALSKLFVFPVFAFGYNWTDSSRRSGEKLKARIAEVIDEAKSAIGLCKKVILLSHSMGGLVCRSASELHDARDKILGIIHGVQPAMGAPAAYWRIKAGFEGRNMASRVLGNSGPNVTVILGNSPGGLQLLPNKLYRTNGKQVQWLRIVQGKKELLALPGSDPYREIYRVKAVPAPPEGKGASNNAYWGLVDPELLAPDNVSAATAGAKNGIADALADNLTSAATPWNHYIEHLDEAESFHDALGAKKHPHTWSFHGVGLETADGVRLEVESNWVRSQPYEKRGFRGLFRDQDGDDMQAVLQNPDGDGDGTVPTSSANSLDASRNDPPGDRAFKKLEHQPAYEDREAQSYVVNGVIALAKLRFQEAFKS